MKLFRKRWHSIPVALVSALLVLALVAGGVLAAGVLIDPVTQTITQDIYEPEYGSITAADITLEDVQTGGAFSQTFPGAVTVELGKDGVDQYLCLTLNKFSVTLYTEYHYKITSPGADNPTGEEIVLYVNNTDLHKCTQLGEAGTYTFTVDIWGTAKNTPGTVAMKVDISLEDDVG